MTNAESAQTNSDPIVTVQDNHLSNLTSDHWVPNEKKKNCLKQQLQNLSSEGMQKNPQKTKQKEQS